MDKIEELIKENKDLEEKKNIYYYEWKHLEAEVINDYIPKSKIRENIKYYQDLYKQDNSPNDFLIKQDCLSKIAILYQLLEGE